MNPYRKNLPLVLLFILCLSASCRSSGQTGEPENFGEVNVKQARAMILAHPDTTQFVVLDTRTPDEYGKSHLEGALFLNYSADDFWEQVARLDREKTYLVYCHSGGRSGETVAYMKENGFKKAYNMEGGIVAWKRKGYGVVKE